MLQAYYRFRQQWISVHTRGNNIHFLCKGLRKCHLEGSTFCTQRRTGKYIPLGYQEIKEEWWGEEGGRKRELNGNETEGRQRKKRKWELETRLLHADENHKALRQNARLWGHAKTTGSDSCVGGEECYVGGVGGRGNGSRKGAKDVKRYGKEGSFGGKELKMKRKGGKRWEVKTQEMEMEGCFW